jgi:sulfatase modifying factor 1
VGAFLFAAGCSYDASVPNATLGCGPAQQCPDGYVCTAVAGASVCCKDGNCGNVDGGATDAVGGDLARAGDDTAADGRQGDGPAGDGPAIDTTASDRPADQASAPDPDASAAPDMDPVLPVDGPPSDVAVDVTSPDSAPDVTPDVRPAPDREPDRCPSAGRGPAMVFIASPAFCIDSTEVTNGHYEAFLEAEKADPIPFLQSLPAACRVWKSSFTPDTELSPWPQPAARREHPVVSVDWCDAWAFCHWAGKRLCGQRGGGALVHGGNEPKNEFTSADDFTMSEWAYACTAGGTRTYPYGGTYDPKSCNTGRTGAANETYMLTKAAGSTPTCEGGYPGLFDLSGNVEEWLDGCTANSGAADSCAVVGGSLFAQSAGVAAEETACTSSSYGSPRNDVYLLRGFRCCAD